MDVLIVRPILCTAEALCLPYTAGLKTGNGMDTLLDTLSLFEGNAICCSHTCTCSFHHGVCKFFFLLW